MKTLAVFVYGLLLALPLHAQTPTIDSLKRAISASSQKTDSTKINLTSQLAKEWASINPDSALVYADIANRLATKAKYKKGIAQSLDNKGWVMINMGHFGAGYDYYMQALQLFQEINDETGIASVYNGLGVTYGMQEKYIVAIDYFLKALTIYERNHLAGGMSSCYLKIGTAYQKTNESDKALVSFQKALKLAESDNDLKGAAFAYNNMASIYGAREQYDKCLDAILKSKELAEKSKSISALAAAYLNLGSTYIQTNKPTQADTCLHKALSLFQQLKRPEQIAKTYSSLAELSFQGKNYPQAMEYIAMSNKYASQVNSSAIKYDNFNLMVEISKSKKDFASASFYYQKLLSLKDSLYNAEKNNSIEVLKAGYELEKKQDIIEELRIENTNKTRQRNWLFFTGIIGTLLLILLTYSFFNIKRKNKIISERKKELSELVVLKDKFFSILSHDLRSPISNILSSLNLFSAGVKLSEADQTLLFEKLKSGTSSALETMDNLLAWGQHQLHTTSNQPTSINLKELSDRVCRFLNQTAENKSIKVINRISESLFVTADKHQLEFVLRNLLGNALKFSNTQGAVEISAKQLDGSVNIYVKDYGTGMTQEVKEKIFDINNRMSKKGTWGEIGSGLGMVLSKEFVTQNHGTITVKSEEGVGTTFKIKLPAIREEVLV